MSELKVGELNGKWSILLRIALAFFPVAMTMGGWICITLIDHGNALEPLKGLEVLVRDNTVKLAEIGASRFTSENGLEVWKSIADLRASMATIPKESPPKWFLDRVNQIDNRLSAIESRLNSIEKQ